MAARRSTRYGKSTRKPRVAKPRAVRTPRVSAPSEPTSIDAHVLYDERKETYWVWIVRASGLFGRQRLFMKEFKSTKGGKTAVLDYVDSLIAKLKLPSDDKVLRTFGTYNADTNATYYITYSDKWYGRVHSVENNAKITRTPEYG